MQISKNILQGVLLGLGAISFATSPVVAIAQAKKVPAKAPQQKDTIQINCPKPNPGAATIYPPERNAQPRVVPARPDSTDLIYKDPCVTCGRG